MLRPTAWWGTRDLLTAERAPLHRQTAACSSPRPPAEGCLSCPGAHCCQLFSRVGTGRRHNGLENCLRWLFRAAVSPPPAPGLRPARPGCHLRGKLRTQAVSPCCSKAHSAQDPCVPGGIFSGAFSGKCLFNLFLPTKAAAELAISSVLWKRVSHTQSANIPSVPSARLSQRLPSSVFVLMRTGPPAILLWNVWVLSQPTGHWGSAS